MKTRIPVLLTLMGGGVMLPAPIYAGSSGCFTSSAEHLCEVDPSGPVDCSCVEFLASPGSTGSADDCVADPYDLCNPETDHDVDACWFSGDSCTQEPGVSSSW
jgi:hypothetical protein